MDHVLAFAPDAPGQLAIRLARTGRHRDPTRAVFGLHLTLEAHINGRGGIPIGVRIELNGNDVFRRPQNRRRDFVDQPQRGIGGARRGDRRRIGATRTVDHRDLRLVDIDIGTIAAAQLQTQIGAQRNRRDIEFLAKHRLGQRRTMRGEILRVPHGNRDRGGRLHCARIGRGLRGDGGGRLRHPQSLIAGRRLVVTLPARDIAEEHGASIGKEFGRRAIDRRRIHPLEIVAFGLARKIGRVPQRQFFIQGIRRLNDLELPAVERWHHPENIDRHRFVHRSEGAAVAHGHHHIAHAAAHSANRIGIDGRVIVRNRCQGVRGNHRVFRGIHDVGAPLGFVLLKGLHQRGEPVNRGRPFRLLGIVGVDQVVQRREIVRAEAIEQQVIFAEGRLLKFALQDERPERARVGVEVETLAEVRRQAREVGLTQIHIGGGAAGNLGQPAGGQGVGLGASRIKQGDAGERTGLIEGDRLLVNDLRTGLATHGGQTVFRARERLADPQLRGGRGPHGLELDFERLTDHRTVRIILPQIRHDGPDGRLRRPERGEPKTGLGLVIIAHAKRGRLARAVVHAAIHPRGALAVDKRKLPVPRRLIVETAVRQLRLGGRVGAGSQRNLVIGHRLSLFAGRKPRGRTVEIHTPSPRTGHAGGPHRQRQYGQRHRRLQDFARLRRIEKLDAREGFVAQHFEDGHRRPLISFDIINEDEFFRGRGQIEIVAQRPGAAIEHEGVFLVGIVARQHRIVLVINTALRLQRGQVIGPGIAG